MKLEKIDFWEYCWRRLRYLRKVRGAGSETGEVGITSCCFLRKIVINPATGTRQLITQMPTIIPQRRGNACVATMEE
jgi:hypothetical protein